MKILVFVFFLLCFNSLVSQSFVKVEGNQFVLDGKPYFFVGSNYWYGMNLASNDEGGDRDRLIKELDHLCELGVKNLRIMAACEGPETEPFRIKPALMSQPGVYNDNLLQGLDFLLEEMGKRGMKAVVCLNNYWPWSGGMAQYLAWAKNESIPYPSDKEGSWGEYMLYTAKFYGNKKANKLYREHIKSLIFRINSVNKLRYIDDPTIMSWQLANEPRGMKKEKKLNKWIKRTAKYIKSLDSRHLVSVGSEGEVIRSSSGNDFIGNHKSEYIDYATIHLWIQNWAWYDPMKPDSTFALAMDVAKKYIDKHVLLARELNKPLVLEEFGVSRDFNNHHPDSPTYWRDKYFNQLYTYLLAHAKNQEGIDGCNVWSWSGSGRPGEAGKMWQRGDSFTGDPPHELQGWYSIYDNDLSTLEIISNFAQKFSELEE